MRSRGAALEVIGPMLLVVIVGLLSTQVSLANGAIPFRQNRIGTRRSSQSA